ncbi:MAG: hypothetical protein H6670_00090 [Anaerolineaceae bacterium]|nr:hypothetical protein [Anaerolineaceae bacterium]
MNRRNPDVLFYGENPQIFLYNGEEVTAAVSYWQAQYTPYGEGQALLIKLDAANAERTDHSQMAIYTDNVPMANYLNQAFNRHFDGWEEDWVTVKIQQARFSLERDSRHYQRVTCFADAFRVQMEWQDIRTHELRTYDDFNQGKMGLQGNLHMDLSHVICLCGAGSIVINGIHASGEVMSFIQDDRFRSSAFIAQAEVWTQSQGSS